MQKPIRLMVALVVVSASLAFSAFSVVRAASGVVRSTLPGLSSSFVSLSDASQTPEPTETVEPTESAEPTHVAEHAHPDEVRAGATPEPTEMGQDDAHSSSSQSEDSGAAFGTPQPGSPEQHHSGSDGSGSGGSGSGGSGSGGDDGGGG